MVAILATGMFFPVHSDFNGLVFARKKADAQADTVLQQLIRNEQKSIGPTAEAKKIWKNTNQSDLVQKEYIVEGIDPEQTRHEFCFQSKRGDWINASGEIVNASPSGSIFRGRHGSRYCDATKLKIVGFDMRRGDLSGSDSDDSDGAMDFSIRSGDEFSDADSGSSGSDAEPRHRQRHVRFDGKSKTRIPSACESAIEQARKHWKDAEKKGTLELIDYVAEDGQDKRELCFKWPYGEQVEDPHWVNENGEVVDCSPLDSRLAGGYCNVTKLKIAGTDMKRQGRNKHGERGMSRRPMRGGIGQLGRKKGTSRSSGGRVSRETTQFFSGRSKPAGGAKTVAHTRSDETSNKARALWGKLKKRAVMQDYRTFDITR